MNTFFKLLGLICAVVWFLALLLLLTGCHNAIPPVITGGGISPAGLVRTAVSLNAIPYLGVLAMSGAVFIVFMGNTKIGLAVGAAGATALAVSLAVIQYAWIMGLLSVLVLIVGGAVAVIGNMKFKRQLVQGVENVKAVIESGHTLVTRDQVNRAVAATQDPDVTAQIKKIKTKLEVADVAHTG